MNILVPTTPAGASPRTATPIEKRWCPPHSGLVKCNINANWRNDKLHSGGSWILRDHSGAALFHAREAFTSSPNRMIAEFRCLIWAPQGLHDLHVSEVIVVSDSQVMIDAITKPLEWPRYRAFTDYIHRSCIGFSYCSIEYEAPEANRAAREIAKSVTRDGRFQSYITMDDLHGYTTSFVRTLFD
ncbi:uncharacterized protein LOC112086423 [Eutrema salsugineum]|uniref:uncharacterized protein LOC112086423 n=1 Tax=Eutrema salsugineum TaxID=72664 RepID=UPI000CECE3BE|nr:uncharacterized protein LOC112086423 [Eutrema salsugineum]